MDGFAWRRLAMSRFMSWLFPANKKEVKDLTESERFSEWWDLYNNHSVPMKEWERKRFKELVDYLFEGTGSGE
jgi:hypothetical protein